MKLFFALLLFFYSFTQQTFAQELLVPKELENKTLSIVIGYGPGGRNDIFARYLTNHIKNTYNLNVIVVNKPGASGAIGAKFVAESESDGTTLHLANDALILGILQGSPGWPQRTQLEPVVNIWSTYNMLIGSRHLQSDNINNIITEMRQNPSKFNYATVFVADGLQFELILNHFKIKEVVGIPFKSGPEIKNSLANNTVQFWITGIGDGISTIRSGIAKPLAVTSDKRLKELPQTPTFNELIPNAVFKNMTTLYVPKNTASDIKEFYNKLFALVNATAEIKKHFEDQNYNLLTVNSVENVKKEWEQHWISVQSYLLK